MSAQSSNGVSHQNYCTTTSQKGQLDKSVNGKLTQKHFDYLTKERGIPEQWVLANFESLTAKEAREMGFTAPSDGILLKSSLPGLQFQFRPDEPTVKTQPNGKQRVIKYLTPAKGEVDAMLPKHPLWGHEYWEDIEILEMYCWKIDGKPYALITEGFNDALIATEKGLPTVALTGVENGLTGSKRDTESKRYLVPALRRYAEAGIGFIISFDADCATNKNVITAQKSLVKQLQLFEDTSIYNITGLWTMNEEGTDKGIGDYIQIHGIDAFRQNVLRRAEPIANWLERIENQLKPSSDNGKGNIEPQDIAKEIAEEYQPNWRFSDKEQVWRFWNGKYWERKSESYIETSVKTILDSRSIKYKRFAFIADTVKLIKLDLTTFNWETFDKTKYIAFDNGVLEVETKNLLPHSPGYGFTSVLPYEYNPLNSVNKYSSVIEALKTECPIIFRFMERAGNKDELFTKKLLAIANAVIKFRFSELQKFVHASGKPGSGKGRYLRLLQKCVGKNNYHGSSLSALKGEYELATIIDKQLVVFSDERKQVGCETVLKLTGGDDVRFRQIRQEPGSAPFLGAAVIASNNAVWAGDSTGLERRLVVIPFNYPIAEKERDSKIEDLMDNEIAQFITISLMLSDEEVTALIRGTNNTDTPVFKLERWKLKTQSENVAAFFNEAIVIDAKGSVSGSDIYDAYKAYCSENGLKNLAGNVFPGRLEELLRVIEVEAKKESKYNRVSWSGIRLRKDYEETPTYEERLEEQVKNAEQDNRCETNTDSNTSFIPTTIPTQTQTEKPFSPTSPTLGVSNKKVKPEPVHTEFKVGDKVKQSKNWVPIGDNPWYGDVIEVIKPNVDSDRETYKVRWRSLEAPLVQEKYGYEIEIDTRKFRTYEDPLP